MVKEDIMNIVKEVFCGLEESGTIDKHIEVDADSVLIGPGAVVDSIAFVTLFTDLEDRLGELVGEDVYLLIDEIHAYNPEDTFLTIGVLIDYIEKMMKEMGL